MANLVEIECPHCHHSLWVDADKKIVIQQKKSKKKSIKSFDTLLQKEKEKKEKADERFIMAKELEQEKKRKAEDLFKKSMKEKK